jgi:hypothetical protein
MKKIIGLVALFFILISCKKEAALNDTYFAFGSAYNFCVGDCAHFFLISDGALYGDDMDRYSASTLKFKNIALPNDKYILAKQLLDNFSQYLNNHTDTTFGCPDCYDQGSYHLQMIKNGKFINWHIDTDTLSQPVEIRNYINDLKVLLQQL